jgi:predicted metal-binding membrane protein
MFVHPVDNRRYFAPMLIGLIALAWVMMIAVGQSPYGRFLDHGEFGEVDIGLNVESLALMALFIGGWTLMTFAMMLPTSLPLIDMFRRMTAKRDDAGWLLTLLITGYVLIWTAFGAAALFGDRVIHLAVNNSAWLEDNAWLIGGATIAVAGLYQFTPLKYMCLDKCRSPMMFITARWSGSNHASSALRLGIDHGIFCVGCCWSLMLLMFVVGVGNVGWMLILGAIMAVEKNMPWGRQLSAPLGASLALGGFVMLGLGASGAL